MPDGDTPRWAAGLRADVRPWLLDPETPAVRHLALQRLLDRPPDDPEVVEARTLAMASDPIAAMLEAQDPEGWWITPGPGYGPKYRSTVWTLMFLDQLGADGTDPRIGRACDYVLDNSQAANGGFGARGGKAVRRPAPSTIIHCLNGNLLRALIGFGRLKDERVQRAVAWQAAAVTGEGDIQYHASGTSGPGFRCGVNEDLPCGWGAAKVLLALARIPPAQRPPSVEQALKQTADFLESRSPRLADYPMGWGNTKADPKWFRFGFPSGYVADVLQVAEGLCEAGRSCGPWVQEAVALILETQDLDGRWADRYAYQGKLIRDIDRQGEASKWVTLRTCTVLRSALGD